ncbi:MAG: hypothetical protein IT223_07930 [Crocinitomicaceae bacterium]|nr:hypothetical protein [Crocinitomicaceae bacterium]
MKLRNFVFLFLGVFAASFFMASCLNEDNKIPPNCYDGIKNNGEQMIDCGGPCEECNHCLNGVWDPWEGETCVDCGGECGPCTPCDDCIQNNSEVGIDCGGDCGPCADLCGDGLLNGTEEEIDCGGQYCPPCPTCTDMVMNGSEIGIDCGGSECVPCQTDGNCTNLIRDGNEFWIDCGGSTCPACDTIMQWTANGVQHVVLQDMISFDFDGTLAVSGTSLQEGTLALNLEEPAGGWNDGANSTLNDQDVLTYLTYSNNVIGVSYGSIISGASITVNVVRFRSTPSPGLIRLTFSGTVKSADGTGTVNITNGLIMVPLQ